tara:strand:+ start:4122 stop:4355 length:234 start_codon:yes stop_codon:yes gene_type:complete
MNNKQTLTYDEYLETLTDYAADLFYEHAPSPADGSVDPFIEKYIQNAFNNNVTYQLLTIDLTLLLQQRTNYLNQLTK